MRRNGRCFGETCCAALGGKRKALDIKDEEAVEKCCAPTSMQSLREVGPQSTHYDFNKKIRVR